MGKDSKKSQRVDPVDAKKVFVVNLFEDEEKEYVLKPNSTKVKKEVIKKI